MMVCDDGNDGKLLKVKKQKSFDDYKRNRISINEQRSKYIMLQG